MTSLAFILGVLPLVFATGAGQEARHSVGTAVAGGMLVSTFLNIVFIPVLYVVVQTLRGRRKAGPGGHDAPANMGHFLTLLNLRNAGRSIFIRTAGPEAGAPGRMTVGANTAAGPSPTARPVGWRRAAMQIDERVVDGVTILDLKGKMTLGEGDELLKDKINSLIQQDRKKLLLNLEGVPYIDSAGLGEIVRTYTTVSRQGAS